MSRPSRWRHLVAWLALGAALAACMPAHAWDPQRMLEAARLRGPRAVEGAGALQALVRSAQGLDDGVRLQAVNDFYNRRHALRLVSFTRRAGPGVGAWASPLELLASGKGESEDYAIAKYLTLLAAGVPPARLRLVYVRAAGAGEGGRALSHMVVSWYPNAQAEPLVLDTLDPRLSPASQRPDLEPVFSFNSEGLARPSALAGGDTAARLTRWREVLAKARAEGLF